MTNQINLTIHIPDLADAINNLAAAFNGKNTHTMCNQYGAGNKHIDNAGAINMDTGDKAPTVPVNPTPAPVTSVPLSATPAQPVAPAANTAPAPVPTAAPQYTLESLATAGSALIDAGKLDQLMAIFANFGVESLTDLSPEHYGAVANDLRALGARI